MSPKKSQIKENKKNEETNKTSRNQSEKSSPRVKLPELHQLSAISNVGDQNFQEMFFLAVYANALFKHFQQQNSIFL